MYRVVVTGIGAITPYGASTSLLRQGLLEGNSALRYDPALKFVVGAVDDNMLDLSEWSAGQKREMSRASLLTLLASKETLEGAKAMEMDHTDTLVNIGACMTDLEHIGETFEKVKNDQARRISPFFVPRILNNLPAGYVAMKYDMKGGVESASTACATGLHCIGNSFRSIRHGYARRAICGAAECAVNPVALAGFDRMRALARGESPSLSRPFDDKRSGFVLSEGVGLLFMERYEDAKNRGAPILAEIMGYSISSDAYHISTPDPSAIGALLSMNRAIADAGVDRAHISYVNAHATSTPNGDSVEAGAIRKLFESQNIAVSSIKGHVGHLLGAAGAVETLATVCALLDSSMPENLNLESSKEDEGLNLLRRATEWPTSQRISIVNSFGFGATNASLVIGDVR